MVLIFTDADCRLQPDCLSALMAAITTSPQQKCFQLHVTGDCSNLLGRAEELRLIAIQDGLRQVDGCIRYLNTSGFAIRRAHSMVNGGLFNPTAIRGEDTLLLANLIQRGELPTFVSDAIVQHSISLSFAECLRKDLQSAWLEGRTYQIIAEKRVRVRMGLRQRLGMLWYTWQRSVSPLIGRNAWFVLVARQSLQRSVSLLYRCVRIGSNVKAEADAY